MTGGRGTIGMVGVIRVIGVIGVIGRRRPAAVGVVAALALLSAACAPNRDVAVGIKEGTTDIVYGGPSTTLPPVVPPAPTAAIAPGFPTFLAPPPPVLGAPRPTPEPVVIPDPCPATPSDARPIPVTPRVDGSPDAGAYQYEQSGVVKRGTAANAVNQVVAEVSGIGERLVRPVQVSEGVGFDVVTTAFGRKRTTSYRTFREVGSSSTDGLYLTRVIEESVDGGSVQEFSPAAPGLLIFPEPASVGTTWRSVATDPIRATSMMLEGRVAERVKVDVCGPRVEAWSLNATIAVRRPGAPAAAKDFTETLTYVVAPQFGAIVLADDVKVSGSDGGTFFSTEYRGKLISLAPRA